MSYLTSEDRAVWAAYVSSPVQFIFTDFRRKPRLWDPILDLHGLTVQDAYNKTKEHLDYAISINHKKITIITGKSGLIQQEFPCWLDSYKPNFKIGSRNNGGSWTLKAK